MGRAAATGVSGMSEPFKPIGVTLGWGGDAVLCFDGGQVLSGGHSTDKLFHPEYFRDGEEWPRDPETGEKLPIAT